MIRAGAKSEIALSSGEWLILDIGFAKTGRRTCGLLVNRESPVEIDFNETTERLCHFIANSTKPVNLVIEAPLSVAFDSKGNPTGHAVEKQGSKTRYWYTGLGCAVMVAALYLVRRIITEAPSNVEIRLFEGFVSFKEKGTESNHSIAEEAGEFWDTHSTSDYEEYLEPGDDSRFWLTASESSLREMWGNAEDDSYAELLEE